jgi:hypothetical protein
VIVGHHLFKAERIKQLLLIPLQPTHHGPFPPLTASTSENHCSQKPSTDFSNKICHKRTSAISQFLICERNRKTASPKFRVLERIHGTSEGRPQAEDARCRSRLNNGH